MSATDQHDLRNAYRYPGKGHWFDFWNCRVLLPEKNLWYFIMIHINSEEGKTKPYFYYGSSKTNEVIRHNLNDKIQASTRGSGVRWAQNIFSPGKIDIQADGYHWNFNIQRICSDGTDFNVEKRIFDVGEKLLLRNNSFVHHVPTMKGLAKGYIKTPNEDIQLENALVYQAKNHGKDFPKEWMWLHVNHMPQFPDSSFEIGLIPGRNFDTGIFRWTNKTETKVYATYLGDSVFFKEKDNIFVFKVLDSAQNVVLRGSANHGEKKIIEFPTPSNNTFETPESFNGYVSGYFQGDFFESEFPALGKGIKK
ncbi:MAG TPA: tocopherol cyclase family protein [Saprospiraceae bacterium]|nr:tocopherol cyclase family protein [Saprospiraceae bacterium]